MGRLTEKALCHQSMWTLFVTSLLTLGLATQAWQGMENIWQISFVDYRVPVDRVSSIDKS